MKLQSGHSKCFGDHDPSLALVWTWRIDSLDYHFMALLQRVGVIHRTYLRKAESCQGTAPNSWKKITEYF